MGRKHTEVMHWASPASNNKTDVPPPHSSPLSTVWPPFCHFALPSMSADSLKVSKPPPHPFVHHVWPSASTHPQRFQGGTFEPDPSIWSPQPEKRVSYCCFVEWIKVLYRTKENAHTQTAKWLKSGLIWLVSRYHSGGVWANRLQRNHWLRWVIGPHARRHGCKKTVTVCGRRTFSQLSGYGGLRIGVVVWKNWTYTAG